VTRRVISNKHNAYGFAGICTSYFSSARSVQLRNLGAVRLFDCAWIESETLRVALVHGADDAHDAGTRQFGFLKLRYRVKALGQGFHRFYESWVFTVSAHGVKGHLQGDYTFLIETDDGRVRKRYKNAPLTPKGRECEALLKEG
jgi:hypothetical protein